ncbi:hypothetical protein D3C77_559750 [compost metagenome]
MRRLSKRSRKPQVKLPQLLASVAEHAHPRAVFTPLLWMPGVADGAEHAFRMRHHYGGAAIAAGHCGNAIR